MNFRRYLRPIIIIIESWGTDNVFLYSEKSIEKLGSWLDFSYLKLYPANVTVSPFISVPDCSA